MRRRFFFSLLFSVPLLVISMGARHGSSSPKIQELMNYFEFILATPVVVWGGWPFFKKFWISLIRNSFNMFTLIGLGVGIAYVFSVVGVFFFEPFS